MNDATQNADPRSMAELVNFVLLSNDQEEVESAYWDAIWLLRWRGTAEVFEVARSLCLSPCPLEQQVGCDILAQLGPPEMPFASASFPIVVAVLQQADNRDTLCSALSALGWLRDPRGVSLVLAFLEHPDADVRDSVTHALISLCDDSQSVDGLIRLTNDPSAEVRDWATFGLGSMTEQDTPAIREALVERLDDPDDIVRGEAMVGLARRRDKRVLAPLARELEAKTFEQTPTDFAQEALEELGDVSEFPELSRWRTSNDE